MNCVELPDQRLCSRGFDLHVADFQTRTAVLKGFIALSTAVTDVAGKSVRGKETPGPYAICITGPREMDEC
jgi:hypothetical protein